MVSWHAGDRVQLALDGINAYKHWKDFLQDDSAEAYFTQTDSLWMLGYDQAANAAMVDRLANFGVGSDVLDSQGIAQMFPQMNTEPMPRYDAETGEIVEVDSGPLSAVFEHGCGHLDSNLCLSDLHRVCLREGVEIMFNSPVAGVTLAGDEGSSSIAIESSFEHEDANAATATPTQSQRQILKSAIEPPAVSAQGSGAN